MAVDTLVDIEDLFADIDLSSVSTSMTVNGPAAILLAMYVAAAEKAGVARADLAGTIQNDILKEYQAQKEYIFPAAAVGAPDHGHDHVHDRRDAALAPGLDLGLPHPGGRQRGPGAGVHAQRLRLRGGGGGGRAGRRRVRPAPELLLQLPHRLLRGDRKLRAARRIWARWMRERYGALDERSLLCRFHTQTAVSLTAHQPEINIARVAVQALAAALAGTQSLHTDSYDEALALPTEKAVRIAPRTQQIIAHETGVASVADPLGGSEYVEWMTDEMERQAEEVFAHLLEIGDGSDPRGHLRGHRERLVRRPDRRSAYRFEREVNAGRRIVVGVNAFTDGTRTWPATRS